MGFNMIRAHGMLAAAITITIAGAVEASAQTADVAGEWTFTVTTDASGTTSPVVTLEQDGEKLTGRYSSDALGEANLSGSMNGSEITFSFSADLLGQLAPVTYTGTVDEDGEISGTMNIAGGLLTGTFTAARSDG